jgi:hypothetical protein
MSQKRVFISSRIIEMRDFREAAVRAIEESGMEPLFFDSTDAGKRWPLKRGVDIGLQLQEAVRSSDAFVGLYGRTLNSNWIPEGETRHIMELEYEAAETARLLCLCYVTATADGIDEDMASFRQHVMRKAVEFLSTPEALYEDLLEQLSHLKPRIFISYSSKDEDFVKRLYDKLRASGQPVWLNTESIPKGERWYDEMVKGLTETDLMILILSPDAIKSKWVQQEWKTFLETQKAVLPILCREARVPRKLMALEMIDAQDSNWYDKLLKAIETRL